MKKFRKNRKRNTMIIIAVATLIGLVVSITRVMSHAYFKTTKSFNIIQGKIPNKSGDVTLAILVDQAKQNTFPDKKNYKYVETVCNEDSNADINFDPNTWKLNITNINSKTICTIKFESKNEYEEEILKGSYPVIKDELVPVVIADNGDVTKADIKDEWYSYANSKWANAVILTGTDNYQAGEVIPEETIESYFVWIPKYRYKLFNVEGNSISPQEIEIEFGINDTVDDNTKNECVATNKSGDDGTCKTGMWMTHPAFTSLGVTGIWVGKFETTGTTLAPTVKPNSISLGEIRVGPMNNLIFNYKRNLDSHTMKNTEWGAVAYLTNSKYGRPKGANEVPTEVWINNNSSYVTGCVGVSVLAEETLECTNPYVSFAPTDEQRKNNVHGSTTDNVSGIYDMSGGRSEYVMGNFDYLLGYSSMDFTGVLPKYYDLYTGNATTYKILGDATIETQGWGSAGYTNFVSTEYPWFRRGGNGTNNVSCGVFGFDSNTGVQGYYTTSRLVLSPSN